MADPVSIQRRDSSGNLTIRVVDAGRVANMLEDGWELVPETDWKPDGVPEVNVQKPLYADLAYNVRDLKEGQRVPLSGTRKQQLGEAQRIADRLMGEGKVTAQW